MGSVSLPVKVFCWLGWKQPRTVTSPYGPGTAYSDRVAEFGAGTGDGAADGLEGVEEDVEAELAEADDRAGRRQHQFQFCVEPGRAGVAFLDGRLVGGRGAADRRHHASADQVETVAGVGARGLRSQTYPIERSEEPVARSITSEYPTGSVATMGRGSQAGNQNPRRRSTPAGDWPTPVRLVGEGLSLAQSNFFPPLHQPGARAADGDPGVEFRQGIRRRQVVGQRGYVSSRAGNRRTG